jgi:hypothetical protein
MDAVIVAGLLAALVFASARWGYDSRDEIHSKEQDLAVQGYMWEDLDAGQPVATHAPPPEQDTPGAGPEMAQLTPH